MSCIHHIPYRKIPYIVAEYWKLSSRNGKSRRKPGFQWQGKCIYCKRNFVLTNAEKKRIFKNAP